MPEQCKLCWAGLLARRDTSIEFLDITILCFGSRRLSEFRVDCVLSSAQTFLVLPSLFIPCWLLLDSCPFSMSLKSSSPVLCWVRLECDWSVSKSPEPFWFSFFSYFSILSLIVFLIISSFPISFTSPSSLYQFGSQTFRVDFLLSLEPFWPSFLHFYSFVDSCFLFLCL